MAMTYWFDSWGGLNVTDPEGDIAIGPCGISRAVNRHEAEGLGLVQHEGETPWRCAQRLGRVRVENGWDILNGLKHRKKEREMKFFIASKAEALRAINPHVTVEAEYGDECVEGSNLTLAHHGPRSDNPPPCMEENIPRGKLGISGEVVVGLSHIDLDSLGGCMAVAGCKPHSPGFWKLAGEVDVKGAHKVGTEIVASPEDEARLYAFWAYSEKNRVFAPRDGSVLDITTQVEMFLVTLTKILNDDPKLLEAGREFKKAGDQLEEASFVCMEDGVILRESEKFVNHLYRHGDVVGKAVVTYNPKMGTITLSLADPIPGVNCCAIAQGLWGMGAGGHAGIAGSPRDQQMTMKEAAWAYDAMIEATHGA